ncbi:hypothetical protein J2W59_001855 [Pseudomonas fluorescens]|nr:hypothetical protein [Pseudomonas fluorescens]
MQPAGCFLKDRDYRTQDQPARPGAGRKTSSRSSMVGVPLASIQNGSVFNGQLNALSQDE